MRFHYGGKFKDESQLPHRAEPWGTKQFKEPKSLNTMAVAFNVVSLLFLYIAFGLAERCNPDFETSGIGIILAILCMIPHEILHAVWFREDVTMYNNLSKGMLFVYGTEDMSKARYIAMNLCPNVVFGLIPFLLYLLFPKMNVLGTWGIMSLAMGVGDYFNVFSALISMPKGAVTYLNGFHSYWYLKNAQDGGS